MSPQPHHIDKDSSLSFLSLPEDFFQSPSLAEEKLAQANENKERFPETVRILHKNQVPFRLRTDPISGQKYVQTPKQSLEQIAKDKYTYLKTLNAPEIYLRLADMQNVYIQNWIITHTDLREANLANSTIEWSELSHSNMSKANLQGVYITESHLEEVILEGADLSCFIPAGENLQNPQTFIPTRFYGANLRGANLRGANLERAEFYTEQNRKDDNEYHDATAEGADLSGANLKYSDIQNYNFKKVCFNGANLEFARLINVDLRGADLTSANLRGTHFENCITDETTRLQ
jgi:uncharacterized protein YjbI with pentapeptide repeats